MGMVDFAMGMDDGGGRLGDGGRGGLGDGGCGGLGENGCERLGGEGDGGGRGGCLLEDNAHIRAISQNSNE